MCSVYQPIVDLISGVPIAFEALARGPEGLPFEMPAQLFPAAAKASLSPELEPGLLESGEIDQLLCLRSPMTGGSPCGPLVR